MGVQKDSDIDIWGHAGDRGEGLETRSRTEIEAPRMVFEFMLMRSGKE